MQHDPNIVIDGLGGTTAVAKICDCKPPSVHQWRTDGIPKYRMQFLRLAFPEFFAELDKKQEAAA